MTAPMLRCAIALLLPLLVLWGCDSPGTMMIDDPVEPEVQASNEEGTMLVQYLEIVTGDVDGACAALEKLHGVSFSEPEPALGNARVATLKGGGRIGVRAPLRSDEEPVVRPYILVEDIEAAVETAESAGGEFAMYPTEIPGHGKFAIYFQGGIQYGLWEL